MNHKNNDQMATEKYSRQILLNEIGTEGQQQLAQKTIAIVGIGALGTVTAELSARAGIGNLILIDRDYIEESNLQRQSLFTEHDIGKSKVQTAKEKLQQMNAQMSIHAEAISLNQTNINLLKNADLILDCTDNLQTRFLINDFAKKNNLPWIYAAAIKTEGYVLPILPSSPCLRCFLQETIAETCDTVGVLNTITHTIASLQFTIALQILLQKPIKQYLIYINIWTQELKKIKIKQKTSCPSCHNIFPALEKKEQKMIRFCSAGKFQIQGPKPDFQKLKQQWQKIDKVIDDTITLRFKNITLFKDGHTLIQAKTEEEAQATYSKYIGN